MQVIAPTTATVGELRALDHRQKTRRIEIRENLVASLREGRDSWPGLHGFDSTVIPQLERALIAGHDIVLLGERGQGKTFSSVVDTPHGHFKTLTLSPVWGFVIRGQISRPRRDLIPSIRDVCQ